MAVGGSGAAARVGVGGASASGAVTVAGANAAFTGGDTLAADTIEVLAADAAGDTLAVDLGEGTAFAGKSAASAI
jgi:hypothetical protein